MKAKAIRMKYRNTDNKLVQDQPVGHVDSLCHIIIMTIYSGVKKDMIKGRNSETGIRTIAVNKEKLTTIQTHQVKNIQCRPEIDRNLFGIVYNFTKPHMLDILDE